VRWSPSLLDRTTGLLQPTRFTVRYRLVFTLHRMHEVQTIVTDVLGVYPSVCRLRGSTRLHCAGVIRCGLCQITLAFCFVSIEQATVTSASLQSLTSDTSGVCRQVKHIIQLLLAIHCYKSFFNKYKIDSASIEDTSKTKQISLRTSEKTQCNDCLCYIGTFSILKKCLACSSVE